MMKHCCQSVAGMVLVAAWAGFMPQAHAAGAEHPYSSVDHKVDAGNPTGDSEVDKLNNSQTDQNYHGQNKHGSSKTAPAAEPTEQQR